MWRTGCCLLQQQSAKCLCCGTSCLQPTHNSLNLGLFLMPLVSLTNNLNFHSYSLLSITISLVLFPLYCLFSVVTFLSSLSQKGILGSVGFPCSAHSGFTWKCDLYQFSAVLEEVSRQNDKSVLAGANYKAREDRGYRQVGLHRTPSCT